MTVVRVLRERKYKYFGNDHRKCIKIYIIDMIYTKFIYINIYIDN